MNSLTESHGRLGLIMPNDVTVNAMISTIRRPDTQPTSRRRPHRVLRNAIRAALSSGERPIPNGCPFTARVFTPAPLKPVGT